MRVRFSIAGLVALFASGCVQPKSLPTGTGGDASAMFDSSQDAPTPTDGSRANGQACSPGDRCASGNCVDGVCCETPCTGKCTSCLAVNTGKPSGTCAPVSAGVDPRNDCPMTDAKDCGTDGMCDGMGACRNYPSGTACSAESCTDGVPSASYVSPRLCTGAGVCAAASTVSCAPYRCNGSKCATVCANSSECISTSYCARSACMPKKPDGQICAKVEECATGMCGGRCCAAGCSCPQPSAQNLIKNPGLEQDATGWMVTVGALSYSTSDADRCPYSGSLQVIVPANGIATVGQCVTAPFSGSFNFGASVQSIGGTALCSVSFYSGTSCDRDLVIQQETASAAPSSAWQTISQTIAVNGANSVKFQCYVYAEAMGPATVLLDALYVSPAPNHF